MEVLRGKAAFLGCVVERIEGERRRWLLVVPGQSYMQIVTKRKQRYRSERQALIIGIEWVLKNHYGRKETR